LQREGTVDIIQSDRTGNYFGYLTINNTNVGSHLLARGQAVIFNPNEIHLPSDYLKAEEQAKSNKANIWNHEGLSIVLKEGEKMSTKTTTFSYVEKNDAVKIRITDMVDFKCFYANLIPNKQLSAVERTLNDYDGGKKELVPLDPPIKKAISCIAKYHDQRHYRVRIMNIFKDEAEVEFLDYGTIDVVGKNDLFKMDDSLSTIPPQVVECELAGLKYSRNSMSKSLGAFPDFVNPDLILNAKILYTYKFLGKDKLGIVVYKEKSDSLAESIHGKLLSSGFAKIDSKKPNKGLEEIKALQQKAQTGNLGMWKEMEASDDEKEIEEEEF